MVFKGGKILPHPALENPTVVVLTDRNDLDDQPFDTFLSARNCSDIARARVAHIRKSVTIDWTLREAARAQIRVLVRRILR